MRRVGRDPEKVRARNKAYQAANAASIKAKRLAKREKDPAYFDEAQRRYRDAHPQKVRAMQRAYYAKNSERLLWNRKLREAGVAR